MLGLDAGAPGRGATGRLSVIKGKMSLDAGPERHFALDHRTVARAPQPMINRVPVRRPKPCNARVSVIKGKVSLEAGPERHFALDPHLHPRLSRRSWA
ncbi:hypothetical protein ACQEVB_23065 [Pseudonocardia sp. CA-107938]|uniref:hypothetical protein n=1 Tax=Pseudonocardia sp. CA-107938 TaxID=3240021 RepID=UPI003D9153C2